MKLILIRHGEKGDGGSLTDKGRWQVKKLATYLSDQKIKTVFCSEAERCIETMVALIKEREEITDIRFTKLVGPKLKKEEYSHLNKRIGRFVEDLDVEFEDEDTVMVVSHNLPIKMFVYYLAKEETKIDEGSVSIFEVSEKEVKKIMVNNTDYLE